MIYEQMIAVYGTIVIEAENKEDAQEKIKSILQRGIPIRDEANKTYGEFLIGDFERLEDVRKSNIVI